MDLIRQFSDEQYAAALESWQWCEPIASLTPRITNAFGDVFLSDDRGAYWFLDTMTGELYRGWDDLDALQAVVDSAEGEDELLMVSATQAATEAGLYPYGDQVLSFKVPPVLGGEMEADNLEVADFVMALNVLGQIHEQVRLLPPGTVVGGFEIG
ncbi:MAG: T6SS immunity protein Tdi1 domain-containing protein [Nocardioides sp.]|uniref:T6SS immunity protein Tdi1 domain-containing protein n=1 Tax=Nocardioides sp. TaxID=35761 RepID=UPI003F0A48E5